MVAIAAGWFEPGRPPAGVLANLATLGVGPLGVGVGASGGSMGLIAAAAACGHREGTSQGRALRDAMLRWSGYTFVIGFAVGADNWAHLFGAIAGAAFGLAVRPAAWTRPALVLVRGVVGLAGVLATVGAVAFICSRAPSPRAEAPDTVDLVSQPRTVMARGPSVVACQTSCTRAWRGRARARRSVR